MAALGLFLVTSSVGRAWCGYTCPQTVWVDLFLVVERFIEGDRNKRIRLDKAPMSASKVAKRVSKHAIWLVIAVATGGAWIFYFADAPSLLMDVIRGDAPTVAYGTIAVLTFTTYSLGGLMREQVCIYMCPWPRIQAAMLDEHSLTVTYNAWRGEPRSRHQKKQQAAGATVGDCVDCNACVAVCPMGIDIRDGQQLECITCALCIDACDGVMQKIGKPTGLISYSTLSSFNHNMKLAQLADGTIDPSRTHTPEGAIASEVRHTTLRSIMRPRTLIYFTIWSLIGLTMLVLVSTRDRLELNVLHDRNPVSVTLSDGTVRNGYTVKILNMMPERRTVMLTIEDFHQGAMLMPLEKDEPRQAVFIDVDPDSLHAQRIFVIAPPEALDDQQTPFRFLVRDSAGSEQAEYDAIFDSGGGR